MAVAQRMSEKAYEEFVLSGVDGLWELHDGRLVEKPGMSWRHLDIAVAPQSPPATSTRPR